ncbi:MAG: hypothetical protein GY842_13315 [bacterium]|nr:hypothetical protein [bacterium]
MSIMDTTFATALNCMDGRVQLPVNAAVRAMFGVAYVDTITAPGMVRFLADECDAAETKAVLSHTRVSLDKHGSRGIAVAAHHDCAGNPGSEQAQKDQLAKAVTFLRARFATCRIVGLWVDADGAVQVAVPAPSGHPDRVEAPS